MHLLLFYPRYVGNLGLPHPLWGVHNPGDFPSRTGTRTALSKHLEVGREAKTPQFSATTHVSLDPLLRWCYSWSSTEKAFLSQPDSPPLGRALFTLCFLFFRELPVQIGAIGGEGSPSPLPPTGPSMDKTVLGWGTGRDWPGHTGSGTH